MSALLLSTAACTGLPATQAAFDAHQTAFAQAILARVRAEGAVRNAQGRLAVSVGESPARPLTVDADDARLREEAGADWLAEQGFDRKD